MKVYHTVLVKQVQFEPDMFVVKRMRSLILDQRDVFLSLLISLLSSQYFIVLILCECDTFCWKVLFAKAIDDNSFT